MPKNPTLEEMEIAKTTLSKIKDFANVEILDTWFEDIWKLEEEIKEKQKHLRKVKKERKLQPSLNVETIKSKELKKIDSGYQIIIGNNGEVFYCKDW